MYNLNINLNNDYIIFNIYSTICIHSTKYNVLIYFNNDDYVRCETCCLQLSNKKTVLLRSYI